jgi:hypothetical protein
VVDPLEIASKRLVFDTVENLYKEYKEENPGSPISKSSFQRIKKDFSCIKAKGEVDGCCICLDKSPEISADLSFVKNQHQDMVKKTCRAIRSILHNLPKGTYFIFTLLLFRSLSNNF